VNKLIEPVLINCLHQEGHSERLQVELPTVSGLYRTGYKRHLL
jgi:hypothetical protein